MIPARLTPAKLVLAGLLAIATPHPATARPVDLDGFARLDLPDGYDMVSQNGPDFLVFRIMAQGRLLLGIYAGNAPDTPIRDRFDPLTVSGCPARLLVTGTATQNLDVLLPIASPQGFPGTIHFFARDLPPAEAAQAQALLARFTLAKTLRCR